MKRNTDVWLLSNFQYAIHIPSRNFAHFYRSNFAYWSAIFARFHFQNVEDEIIRKRDMKTIKNANQTPTNDYKLEKYETNKTV